MDTSKIEELRKLVSDRIDTGKTLVSLEAQVGNLKNEFYEKEDRIIEFIKDNVSFYVFDNMTHRKDVINTANAIINLVEPEKVIHETPTEKIE